MLKRFLANELQLQFEKLSNQARFEKIIINKNSELVVCRYRRRFTLEELPAFPQMAKAKSAGEYKGAEREANDDANGRHQERSRTMITFWAWPSGVLHACICLYDPVLVGVVHAHLSFPTHRSRNVFSRQQTRRRRS